MTALRELDSERKGQLIRFLQEANLIRKGKQVIDLISANLFGANLSRAYLSGADLSNANLIGANLSHANLSHADLKNALFCKATMLDGKENNQNCPQKQLP